MAGQKSGVGWAFDPDNKGAVLWQYRAGKGSALGGLEFGSAVDSTQAYFAVSDMLGGTPGGLHAVKLSNGERAWYTAPETPKCGTGRGCNNAILAAITVIPGVVFTGSNDGAVRGYSTKDGSLLWEYDTNRSFDTVNGVPAKGRVNQRSRPRDRGRHALHQLGVRRARRAAWKRAVGVRHRVAPVGRVGQVGRMANYCVRVACLPESLEGTSIH